MTDNPSTLELKSVHELLDGKFQFEIPDYQRGYRWTKQNVEDLLKDFKEFLNSDPKEGEFYCLQPLVVKADESTGNYEVIDGQQRLTTLHLILSFVEAENNTSKFSINYEKRKCSRCFLEEIKNKYEGKEKDKNIDFFHMSRAYQCIVDWFNGEDENRKEKFKNLLRNGKGGEVKFIWYEVQQEEKPKDLFTRLNAGKVPLSNADLAKAWLLKHLPQEQQFRVTNEWEHIHTALSEESFWAFIQPEKWKPEHKLELMLALSLLSYYKVESESKVTPNERDPHNLFRKLQKEVKNRNTAETAWQNLLSTFYVLQHWYQDHSLYHIMGYLIKFHRGSVSLSQIEDLISDYTKTPKSEFIKAKKEKIKGNLESEYNSEYNKDWKEIIEEVEYGDGNDRTIKKILWLFNIALHLKGPHPYRRFNFLAAAKTNWDIEHIHATATNLEGKTKAQKEWMESAKEFIKSRNDLPEEKDGLLNEINYWIDKPENQGFNELVQEILKHLHMNSEASNSLGNLTLLPSKINISIKNKLFPIKREKIMEADKNGEYFPLGSLQVFFKYYSSAEDEILVALEQKRPGELFYGNPGVH